ncbi:hypothetical protein EVAR_63674_1 [Eumeta japonica]|uniref:Uncharacterized protein n=1 Tax=Eumeta variegata TaxID=151549 RepID=A0A4C1ZM54_EUMVA|nr:hypothetical protein EVAR_63674_1 [Eumeta japonica]
MTLALSGATTSPQCTNVRELQRIASHEAIGTAKADLTHAGSPHHLWPASPARAEKRLNGLHSRSSCRPKQLLVLYELRKLCERLPRTECWTIKRSPHCWIGDLVKVVCRNWLRETHDRLS